MHKGSTCWSRVQYAGKESLLCLSRANRRAFKTAVRRGKQSGPQGMCQTRVIVNVLSFFTRRVRTLKRRKVRLASCCAVCTPKHIIFDVVAQSWSKSGRSLRTFFQSSGNSRERRRCAILSLRSFFVIFYWCNFRWRKRRQDVGTTIGNACTSWRSDNNFAQEMPCVRKHARCLHLVQRRRTSTLILRVWSQSLLAGAALNVSSCCCQDC